ncbi:MAG: hypothetical protein CVU56_28855 [Deltaproteobacteria bacterium HGW-Deltaproteobacteria-14]|jgi:acetylornithine deacetylase/succinyl-diaminopimelate desuccinylase-like protein|nr:MAG: hypothetical protein CVU56_28855 [Deltaproteobacteria bacterium HGW-Deltaproteobacteria-14]
MQGRTPEAQLDLIARIIAACPRRVAASDDERRAQRLLAAEFEAHGATTATHRFRFSVHLYAVLALHFGLAAAASLVTFVAPWVALGLHLLAGVSYLGDSYRRFHWLRRLLPYGDSQNLVATLPAAAAPRLRVVLVAHADAAYTGLVFTPALVRRAARRSTLPGLGWVHRSVLLVVAATFALAALDVVVALGAPEVWPAVIALSLPPLIGALLNLDVVLRNTVVPGANDNLSGCVGAVELCARLAPDKPDDVELAFVCTGAEEAGTGGALALARTRCDGRWSPADTLIVAIDGLSNGALRILVDGELFPAPPPRWMTDLVAAVAATDAACGAVAPYEIPSGATDALPFAVAGFESIALGCIDPDLGAPGCYHLPTDTPDNMDPAQLGASVDFVEAYVRALIAHRSAAPTP